MKKKKQGKPVYESPKVIRLDDSDSVFGGEYGPNDCYVGTNASSLCENGNDAGSLCQAGSSGQEPIGPND